MSARAPLSRESRRARPALVIDGDATVVSRKAAPRRAQPNRDPAAEAAMPFAMHEDTQPRPAFGRRPAGKRPFAPDLVFQGAAWSASEPGTAKAPRRGLSLFTDAADFAAPRERRMAGLAVVLAVLALPVLVLSVPIAPAEATPGAGRLSARPVASASPVIASLVIDEVVTSIVPRGTGAVLSVEGRIRNRSGHAAPVPPVRIALAQAMGGPWSKSLVPAVASLPAGHSLRFHSAVAIAKDARGTVEVGFLAPPAGPGATPSGKTLVE